MYDFTNINFVEVPYIWSFYGHFQEETWGPIYTTSDFIMAD